MKAASAAAIAKGVNTSFNRGCFGLTFTHRERVTDSPLCR